MCDLVSAYRWSLTCPLTGFAVLRDSINNPRLFMGDTAYFRGRIDEKVKKSVPPVKRGRIYFPLMLRMLGGAYMPHKKTKILSRNPADFLTGSMKN